MLDDDDADEHTALLDSGLSLAALGLDRAARAWVEANGRTSIPVTVTVAHRNRWRNVDVDATVTELVKAGWWKPAGDGYQIKLSQRDRDRIGAKVRMRRYRERQRAEHRNAEAEETVTRARARAIENIPPRNQIPLLRSVGENRAVVSPKRRWTRVPAGEALTPRRVAMALEERLPAELVPREWARFTDHDFARAKQDVDATWRNWIREAVDRLNSRRGPRGSGDRLQQTLDAARAFAEGDA